MLLSGGCKTTGPAVEATPTLTPALVLPEFVGSERCSGCHLDKFEDWEDSHHHQAMLKPTDKSVLGDFDDAEFEYFGFRSKFFRKGDEFWVETDGPEGVKKEFKVEYTFGFKPLQQYLIKFPDGRLQALSISWDTEKKRWFHLHPKEQITAQSSLHWTSPQYNWNFMCAECHSTGVNKNYDSKSDTFDTTYEEINVSCESCHGPGSQHLESLSGDRLPNHGFPTSLKGRGPWKPQTQTQPPLPENPEQPTQQVETCARCHARRSVISEPYEHGQVLAQTHPVSVLTEGLYHPDGQIQDEVYVYGSFLQSKMYQAGVVCTDCHDAHTNQVKTEGDNLCLQCHMPQQYKSPSHSHHKDVSCIDCHMVGKVYMGNDYRRDHSFRIPRPDLSQEIGSPNACNACHQDKGVDWASAAYKKWYGEGSPHYGQAIQQGRTGDPRARKALADLAADSAVPGIVRATAVSLAPYPEVIQPALSDTSDLVRREAVKMLQSAPPEMREKLLSPLASDPVRAVRIEVGRLLVGSPSGSEAVKSAIGEYRESLKVNADRTESQLGMAALQVGEGDLEGAEKTFQRALDLNPRSIQAYVNLADFYRASGRDREGETILRVGVEKLPAPEAAALHHALGLLLVREGRYEEALGHLKTASEQAPQDTQAAFVYAVALESMGKLDLAVKELERVLESRPYDPQILSALVSFLEKSDPKKAQLYRERLH
jgi:predicted CXXCH cytochrome family protein